jgi:hypothetical protein
MQKLFWRFEICGISKFDKSKASIFGWLKQSLEPNDPAV